MQRSLVGGIVAVAACCGVAWLLVAAGVLGATAGLASSPELTVATIAVAAWATVRLSQRVRGAARQELG